MKTALLTLITFLFCVAVFAQDKTKKTNFQYAKSHVADGEMKADEIRNFKEKDFTEDERTITILPADNAVVFDLGFVEKTIKINDEKFSLIDKQWQLRLGDANFAFLIIGEDYALIRLEEDNRTLLMITEQFKFKK